MPTLSQDSVKTLPMLSRSAMTLEEIRQAMTKLSPSLHGFEGGWASMNNYKSNLRRTGVEPPKSDPSIVAPENGLPEMLRARFYFWDPAPAGMKDQEDHDPLSTRRLNAIDVIITTVRDGMIGILFSTRTRTYLNRTGGVIASLNRILQSKDKTIAIERDRSHLELHDPDIFLWLAVQHRDRPQLAPDLFLDGVSGISSRDQAMRTAELRSGVDFDRSNFLTAVAELDTLGPIDVALIYSVENQDYSYDVRIHVDGGFEIRRNAIHFEDLLNADDVMLETSLRLGYSLIPRINDLYQADASDWNGRRGRVVQSAMTALEERYRDLRSGLQKHLDAKRS